LLILSSVIHVKERWTVITAARNGVDGTDDFKPLTTVYWARVGVSQLSRQQARDKIKH